MTAEKPGVELRLPHWATLAFAVSLVGFGALQLIFTRVIAGRPPAWPTSVYGESFVAVVTGLLYVGAGALILLGNPTTALLIASASIFLIGCGGANMIAELRHPNTGALLTSLCKSLTLGTGALLVAHERRRGRANSFPHAKETGADPLIRMGAASCRFVVGVFLVVGGVQHFRYLEFVAQLIPSFFPVRTALAQLAGVALIATGAGMLFRTTLRLSASAAACMIAFWVLALHLPRAISAGKTFNEWTAFFEAIAVSALLTIIAIRASENATATRTA